MKNKNIDIPYKLCLTKNFQIKELKNSKEDFIYYMYLYNMDVMMQIIVNDVG